VKSLASVCRSVINWLDSDYFPEGTQAVLAKPLETEYDRWVPFLFLHLGCLAVFFVGISPVAVTTAVALYVIRMFAITGFYHRYFSHRSFRTSRAAQFIFAVLGLAAVQRGPLWWAAHHRNHHRKSDLPGDTHSPRVSGFLWSHIGWITCSHNMPTNYESIGDLTKFKELVFLNRFDWLVPAALFIGLYGCGAYLQNAQPQLHTTGAQMLVWGFFISTVFVFHATASINSFGHIFGWQRYDTDDDSRNNFWLALFTLGEGWHNNHHQYSYTVRQGFYWWEIDFTYYGLSLLALLGVVKDFKAVPEAAYAPQIKPAVTAVQDVEASLL
jgi:stearoyl-CoA desaturase (Delta-9 desaturase)